MSIVIVVLEEDHEFQVGDTIIPIKRLMLSDSGGTIWTSRVAMLMDMDGHGHCTPVKVGAGERVPASMNG